MNDLGKALMFTRTTCRLCESPKLETVLKLTPTPPANAFVPADRRSQPQPTYPLNLSLCRACGHVQLLDVVDPEELFRDYVYVSGTSPVFVNHFKQYAEGVMARFHPASGRLVVELGSNDGTLLKFFKESGLKTLGIDPARDIAKRATADGIETWPEFFTTALARRIKQERGAAAVMTANNVFAHIDDLGGVVDGVRELLAPDGVFVFEVSYLMDVVEHLLFDTIYHEHLCYHAVKPLVGFFKQHGLELFDAERIPTHGGSLRGYVQLAGGPRPRSAALDPLLAEETRMGLDRPETFKAFGQRLDDLKTRLGALLAGLKSEGKRVAGYGAPAKATTLLYHFDLGQALEFIVDDSPLKQGLYSPGHHLPVRPSKAIYEEKPDYLLILAWNFASSIMKSHVAYAQQGGRFIIPLPDLEVK